MLQKQDKNCSATIVWMMQLSHLHATLRYDRLAHVSVQIRRWFNSFGTILHQPRRTHSV